MKKTLLILIALSVLASCGRRKIIEVDQDTKKTVKDLGDRVKHLEDQVAALEISRDNTIVNIANQQAQIDAHYNDFTLAYADLSSQIANIEAALNASDSATDAEIQQLRDDLAAANLAIVNLTSSASAQNTTLVSNVTNLQNSVNAIQAQITALSLNENVVAFVDPCGDGAGFDEVLLKTSSGKFVAYFENGGNRFLTVLDRNTSYRTTDAQSCNFSLDANGIIHY